MSKRLKRFGELSGYCSYLSSSGYSEPQVSSVEENKSLQYDNILFLDPEVRRVVSNTWYSGSTDLLFSKKPIAGVTQLGQTFYGNTVIKNFDDLDNFINVSSFWANGSGGNSAGSFRNCTNLISVKIPPKVRVFGNGLFRGCTKLQEVKNTSAITSIGEYCFEGCSSLKTLDMKSVTTIE